MAFSSISCGVCVLRHLTNSSIVWCTECDEGLCKGCQEHHGLSKASRNHKTIEIEEYQKLPLDVLRITQCCSTHQEKFIIYCPKHESPCCRKCIVESHKECRDIENLDEVINNFKTSNAVFDIEETLVEVAENLQKIRKHQQENLLTLKEKRNEIQKEILKTRTTINNHLDKLQDDLMKQLYATEEKENSKIRQLLSTLEKKEKKISDIQQNIVIIKQHATDLQFFLSIKQIEEDVSSKDDILISLVKDENLKNHSLEYKINTSIQNIISDIKSFGEIHVNEKLKEIILSRKKTKQAQIMVPSVQSRSIEDIKLAIKKTINTCNTKGDYVFGCCMLPDDKVAFTYYNELAVKVFNHKGLKDFEVKMPCKPFDIVFNSEDNTLAVTSGISTGNCITIINLKNKRITKKIPVDSEIDGIALKGDRLIYSCDKGIRIINPSDWSISIIVRDEIPRCCYIATFGNQIYHSNCGTQVVTCYNQQGKLQWTFHNEKVLKYPRGIDVDKDGNVYVVGYISNNVIVISPDGKCHREVLAASDGLNRPLTLTYNDSTDQMLVANSDDNAKLFNLL